MQSDALEPLLSELFAYFDPLPFEQVENDLTLSQLVKLHDAYRSFAHQSSPGRQNFKNRNLLLAFQAFKDTSGLYSDKPAGEN